MSKKKTALMQLNEIVTDIKFKPIKVCHLRDYQHKFKNDKITYSRMVELLNEVYQEELKIKLKELRETEKQDLIEAHECGFTHYDAGYKLDGQQWFNEKYDSDGE